jgi:hypothetical protein
MLPNDYNSAPPQQQQHRKKQKMNKRYSIKIKSSGVKLK